MGPTSQITILDKVLDNVNLNDEINSRNHLNFRKSYLLICKSDENNLYM